MKAAKSAEAQDTSTAASLSPTGRDADSQVSRSMTPYTIQSGTPSASAPPALQGKRAAMVTFSPYPGDPRPRRAVDALLSQGMSVDLICLAHEGSLAREESDGLKLLRVPIKHRRGGPLSYAYNYSAFLLISMAVLAGRTLQRRFDLVWVHNMPDFLVLSALGPKLAGAKVVLDMHDPMPELMTTIFHLDKRALGVRVMQWLERWSMAMVDAVVTVNIACKRIFASRSCRPEKIAVVMNSPDEEIFPFRAPEARRSATAQGRDKTVIMYHGSLVERNGLDLAIDAMESLRSKLPGAELRIYGKETPFLSQLLESAASRGLQDCVQYLGPRRLEDLIEAIDDCDVGVIPNPRNAFTEINTPTRIFEYLARGKPVVAPRTPGIEDYFDGESLFYFEPGDANDLVGKILEVASSPKEAAEGALRGQQVYRAHTWAQERETLVGVAYRLLKREKKA